MSERIYVAIGCCFWGKGLTAEQAKKAALKYRPRSMPKKMRVIRLPEGAHSVYVTDTGQTLWEGTTEPCEVIEK